MLTELAQRTNGGITVSLLWDPSTNQTFISIVEGDKPEFTFEVPASTAADAFHHPFAYAA